MELLKVFVGDASGVASSLSTMVPGDLLLLNAKDYSIVKANAVSGVTDVVIASCINKNGVNTPVFSTPIKKTNIRYISAANDNENTVTYNGASLTKTSEASVTATIGSASLIAGDTYTLAVQIKEDLRMGTYNKNTEIMASYTVPSSAVITTDAQDLSFKNEMVSILAKGFSANPLTSAGSPYQLVNVERSNSGTVSALATSGTTLSVVKGAREVTMTHGTLASTPTVGGFISIYGKTYLIEKYTTVSSTVKIITLDTAYQGATDSAVDGNTSGDAGTQVVTDTWVFTFTGVSQSQKNRYDQFRMVDFDVFVPKGNTTSLITIAKTAPVYPIGSFRQIRDLEEKAYTNSNPLINYREFPFETFPLNATSGTYYCMLTVAYTSGWGYNMMQSNQAEFLQTAVVAAPFQADGQFDVTPTTTNAGSFLETWAAWAGAPTSGSYTFV